jgi:hypothetical protein
MATTREAETSEIEVRGQRSGVSDQRHSVSRQSRIRPRGQVQKSAVLEPWTLVPATRARFIVAIPEHLFGNHPDRLQPCLHQARPTRYR